LWSGIFGGKPLERSFGSSEHPIQRIYLFISSTFNDMHAERDYLVKYVFPELKDWCFSQGLELIDIDLRWGITDEEAARNQTVDTCLNVIRMNTPMLLINLTGERTGWVPEPEQVSSALREAYPAMRSHYGDKSITELEVLFYELVTILDGALFLIRQPEGPCNWNTDQKKCYTNYGEKNQKALDKKLRTFKKKMLCGKQAYAYRCQWDPTLLSPELIDAEAGGERLPQAAYGRFREFAAENGQPLKDFILDYFKNIISSHICPDIKDRVYSGHGEAHIQQRFLIQQGVSYLSFPGSFDELERAIGGSKRFLVLSGEAGAGKSAYLANFILTHRDQYDIHYRFLGISGETTDEISMLNSLAGELADKIFAGLEKNSLRYTVKARKFPDVYACISKDTLGSRYDIAEGFPNLMNQMEDSLTQPLFIVLDGLDQLDYASMSWVWANSLLYFANSCRVRFIISCKSGTPHAEMLRRLAPPSRAVWMHAWTPEEGCRRAFINYLTSHHLKHLTEEQEAKLLYAPQGGNFLFLKSAVEEICTWGIRTRLDSYLDDLAGQDLQGTFQTILSRAEQDQPYCRISPKAAIPTVLGLLAYSRYGLSFSCMLRAARDFLSRALNYNTHPDGSPVEDQDITEAIHYYTYQLKHFLIFSHGKVDILYDSFRQACQDRFSRSRLKYHAALALAYLADMDPKRLHDFDAADAYREYPYHVIAAEEYRRAVECLSDLAWLCRKAQLGQICQVPELYRRLPGALQDQPVMSWLHNYESILTREPMALPSLYMNFFPDRAWRTESMPWPWLTCLQDVPEFRFERNSVRKILPYRSLIEFPTTVLHNSNLYFAHGGHSGAGVLDAATLRPMLILQGGRFIGSKKILSDEDMILQWRGGEAIFYRLLPDYGGTVTVRITGLPEIIDIWYGHGAIYLWTTEDGENICLLRAVSALCADSTAGFDELPWETVYRWRVQKPYYRISASSAGGVGVITMQLEDKPGCSGCSILYTYPPFRVLSELPYPVTHWQKRAPDLLLLHREGFYTELMDLDGELLIEANFCLDLTPADEGGVVFLHMSGFSRANRVKQCADHPITAAGSGTRFPAPPATGAALTACSGGKKYRYLIDAGYFYRFQIRKTQEPPEAVAFYHGETMYLENYKDCLLTQELDRLHIIPLSGTRSPFQIEVPQLFLGFGFGTVPGVGGTPGSLMETGSSFMRVRISASAVWYITALISSICWRRSRRQRRSTGGNAKARTGHAASTSAAA